ncbi:hypothetical protein GCM10027590_32430 [Nocardiopsis nanhaiensis]
MVGMLSSGCATQVDDTEPSVGETPEPTESTSPEELAVDTYEAMWSVVVEASHEGDADPPELETYASGDALALMRQTLDGTAGDQVDVEGEPVLDPEVVEASPEHAPETVTLLDCADGSEWVENGTDSDEEDREVGPRQIDATVNHDGLSWRVSDLRIWEPGTC